MSRLVVEKNIPLEPNKLDCNLYKHLLEKINNTFLNRCDQEYGYIVKIYDNVTILSNIISSTSPNVIFKVKFGIKSIKPETGKKYKCKVCMVFPNGIIAEIENKIKVVIPINKLTEYTFEKTCFKKDNITISKNDDLDIVIDMVKYEKQNFNCIARVI
jgi:hypothetical protein